MEDARNVSIVQHCVRPVILCDLERRAQKAEMLSLSLDTTNANRNGYEGIRGTEHVECFGEKATLPAQ